jgi:hypothetical protein
VDPVKRFLSGHALDQILLNVLEAEEARRQMDDSFASKSELVFYIYINRIHLSGR